MLSRYESGNRFIDSLPLAERAALTGYLQLSKLEAGDVLWEASATIDVAVFPIDAVASAVMEGEDGSMVEIMTVGDEGILCFSVAGFGGPVLGRCVCLIGGTVATIDGTQLTHLAFTYPVIGVAINVYSRAIVFSLTKSIFCNRFHSLSQRCANFVLYMHDRCDGRPFPMTQDTLAGLLGASRASVAVIQEALQEEGALSYRRGVITVKNAEILAATACNCNAEVKAAFRDALAWN